MTQEEKARAYDEALERAKKFEEKHGGDYAGYIFPELAESEDESTRKALIETVKCIYDGDTMFLSEQQRDRYLAWLEKQKEQKPEWSDEDEKRLELVIDCVYEYYQDPVMKYKLKDWLKSLHPQPKQEWGEEDEKMINGCIHAIEYELIDNGQDEQVATDTRIAFLKSIRPQPKQEWSDTNELVFQDICKHLKEEGCGGWVLFLKALRNGEFQPKQEWSEEDEKMLSDLRNTLGCLMNAGAITFKTKKKFSNWLKSLRPSWKPSEEQMNALLDAEGFLRAGLQHDSAKTIAELYEQLKKL